MSIDVQSKKKLKFTDEDRISALPDDLIHQILKSVDTKEAVQTSILSKRWKFVWTTLPFLKFKWAHPRFQDTSVNKSNAKFTRHVLNYRNHNSSISCLELKYLTPGLLDRFIKYAIAHHVECLDVHLRHKHKPYMLGSFSSGSIKKLKVRMSFEDIVPESDCWDLPALTSLHLCRLFLFFENQNLPERCITCLPALRDLCLEDWDLRESSLSFNWPGLTSFCLIKCILPTKVWNFPGLKSLELLDVTFPKNMREIFTALVSLKDLILSFDEVSQTKYFLHCPELVNLEIRTRYISPFFEIVKRNFVVSAPKLKNFTSVGIFTVKFDVPELDNVYMKLRGWIDDQSFSPNQLKEYYRPFRQMLLGLGGAKILHFELETIKALSSISDFLGRSPPPFCNLKYVKLPHGSEEAIISNNLRSYLLGASPTASIVTTFSQSNMKNSHTTTASVTSQNVALQKPLVSSTKVLVDSGNVPKTVCINTVDVGVQAEHVVRNSVQHTYSDRVRHVGSPVDGTDNDHARSSSGNPDIRLWRGYDVNSKFVCILNAIMDKYPETFEHFATRNRNFSEMKLNMLCTSVHDFVKMPVLIVDAEILAGYWDVFADLQKLGFDVSWLVSRLVIVEQLYTAHPLLLKLHAIDCDIDDAQRMFQDLQFNMNEISSILQNLQTLRNKKLQEIRKVVGTTAAKLAGGYIGDDLLPVT
ncbi:uncharacterized protein LOC108193489 [Daucus carota subsp. sativus]|uniref:uncharacterized protein LOC108193489 n=1 Tax=Daucus carota subsp. sativus TaxID=79200 RepID=UPI0007EF1F40|nr:PREDICTED: uncharacterized protein LOC108193489 [Daucus carota subsp. sativus]